MEPQFVTTEYFDNLAALALKASVTSGDFAGPLTGSKVGLFVNNITPGKSSIVSELTEASFAGYAKRSLTFGLPKRDENGNIGMDSGLSTWQPTDGVLPQTAYGYFVTNSAGTQLLGGAKFENPQTLTDALSALEVVVNVNVSNPTGGQATVAR